MSGLAHRPRVLVVYKKSAYQLYVMERRNRRVERLVAERHPSVALLLSAHQAHVETLSVVRELLKREKCETSFRYRREQDLGNRFDLVVTVGGDGTLLWASHAIGAGIPIVAINSAPKASVGYFCAASGPQIRDAIADALRGRLRAFELTRMRVTRDNEILSERVLNDALFCHAVPAATTRYILRSGRSHEEQKSSGIWIGPAAGSTAAQRSAGGQILPIESKDLQWVVREPYEPLGTKYTHRLGLIGPRGVLELQNKIQKGRLYLDGPNTEHRVDIGQSMTFSRSKEPLTLLGLRPALSAS